MVVVVVFISVFVVSWRLFLAVVKEEKIGEVGGGENE